MSLSKFVCLGHRHVFNSFSLLSPKYSSLFSTTSFLKREKYWKSKVIQKKSPCETPSKARQTSSQDVRPAFIDIMKKVDDQKNEKSNRERKSVEELREILRDVSRKTRHIVDHSTVKTVYTLEKKPKLTFNSELFMGKDELDFSDLKNLYGSPDPSVPPSKFPCLGCGAVLHCQDSAIPGYLPSEKYKILNNDELQNAKCHKCHMMQNRDVIFDIRSDDDAFEKILQKINKEYPLILLMIDLCDIENSIIKGLFSTLNRNFPVYIVGNKVDLIPNDGSDYLKAVEKTVLDACNEYDLNPMKRNIQHISLISAKTGYGVENLITKLLTDWQLKGNVYMIGKTNTGKSTLYNALLNSDYCKEKVRDSIPGATVSIWPGTTINLLKFPVLKPDDWKMRQRNSRLNEWREKEKERRQKQTSKYQFVNDPKKYKKIATLHEKVGKTEFKSIKAIKEEEKADGFSLTSIDYSKDQVHINAGIEHIKKKQKFNEADYPFSIFCYDTPGVIDDNLIMTHLHAEELKRCIPQQLITPRMFLLKPDHVMFISGLVRIDYFEGDQDVFLTLFVESKLPVHIMEKSQADSFYNKHIGTKLLGVPLGDKKRLDKLPPLKKKEFRVFKLDYPHYHAAGDIQLSSLGWVAVHPTMKRDFDVTLNVYMPGGLGMYQRPSMIKNVHSFHRTRVGESLYYRRNKPLIMGFGKLNKDNIRKTNQSFRREGRQKN